MTFLSTIGDTALTKMIHGATPDKVECGFTLNYVLISKTSRFQGLLQLGHACVTLTYVTQLLQGSRVTLDRMFVARIKELFPASLSHSAGVM